MGTPRESSELPLHCCPPQSAVGDNVIFPGNQARNEQEGEMEAHGSESRREKEMEAECVMERAGLWLPEFTLGHGQPLSFVTLENVL